MHAIGKTEIPSRHEVWQMFDRIARRYDLLNHTLSFGQDILWRRSVKAFLPRASSLKILDIATGTADQLISVSRNNPQISGGVGVDLAAEMLRIGEKKIKSKNLADKLKLQIGDACDLQFPDNVFDAATISFGIRNVMDLEQALSEMLRVLKPGGRAIILEFSLPSAELLKKLYLFYFRRILPLIGALISGDRYAYTYLNKTVESFPFGRKFLDIMGRCGFQRMTEKRLSFGIASLYCAVKPGPMEESGELS